MTRVHGSGRGGWLDDDESISDTGLGEDVSRTNDVPLDLAAQVRDLNAKILLRVTVAAPAPDLAKERLMRERAPRLRCQCSKDLPLRPRELHVLSVHGERTADEID